MAGDAHRDLSAVAQHPAPPPRADVDDDDMTVSARPDLDPRLLDRLAHLVAAARRVELDDRVGTRGRLNLHLAGGHPQLEHERPGRLEGLPPQRGTLVAGRRRSLRGLRGSVRTSM